VGCGITAYFLFSGIHYFSKRDPINSHRMMRYRVMAQFMTLGCFFIYLGGDQPDFRIAPKYQDKLLLPQQPNKGTGGTTATTTDHLSDGAKPEN
jgi:Hypoxia induced protein conserved region